MLFPTAKKNIQALKYEILQSMNQKVMQQNHASSWKTHTIMMKISFNIIQQLDHGDLMSSSPPAHPINSEAIE